jgi:hypothetical protein
VKELGMRAAIRLALACTAALAALPAGAAQMAPGSEDGIGQAAPGTMTVRLDAAVLVEFGAGGGSNDSALVSAGTQQVTVRNNRYGIVMYARLYPGFDAQTPGGLRYGAHAELRGNDNTGGANGTVGTAGQRTTNTLFWNQAYGYLGSDQLGLLRFGMVDGPFGLMKVGTFEGFGDGGLNRSNLTGLMPKSDGDIWYFPISVSDEYSSQKLSYTSPSWRGFDFGLSFAPSTGTHMGSDGGLVLPGGSARQSVSTLASDADRYTNLVEAVGRYRAAFAGVGVAATLGYMGSNRVNVPGMARQGLSLFDAGAQVSYQGFSFGGHFTTGRSNGTTSLSVPGAKNSTVWLVGAQYERGAWLVGAHYLNGVIPNSTAIPQPAALRAQGVAAGVNWNWAPGVSTYVEGIYISKNQPGVDLRLGNAVGSSVNASQVVLGQRFRW